MRWAECINVAPPRKRNREDIDAAFDAFFNPLGLRAWQLAEEHRLALERQAEEHHRDHGPIAARQEQGIEASMRS